MKKILMSIVAVFAAMSMNAQVYLGGSVAFEAWSSQKLAGDKSETVFKIMPEIGYNINDEWAIGTVIGYMSDKFNGVNGVSENAFVFNPYARYTFLNLDKVNVFVDGGFGFYTYKWKYEGIKGEAQNAWEVGLKPGVAVNLNDKLSFVTHFGFFGYRDADETPVFGRNGFGLDASGNALTFGLYWNF